MTEDTKRQEVEAEEFGDGISDEALDRTPLVQACEYSRRGPYCRQDYCGGFCGGYCGGARDR